MEEYITLIGIVSFVGMIMNKVSSYYVRSVSEVPPKTPKQYNIQYYSNGKLLPNSFNKEYKMIRDAVANSWIYEEQFQELVNENHDAPIVEIDVKLPFPYSHSYSFKHVFLANSYLQDQKEYLENLS